MSICQDKTNSPCRSPADVLPPRSLCPAHKTHKELVNMATTTAPSTPYPPYHQRRHHHPRPSNPTYPPHPPPHHPRSLPPKSRKNIGETLEACALRATWEGTGFRVELMAHCLHRNATVPAGGNGGVEHGEERSGDAGRASMEPGAATQRVTMKV